MIAVVDLRLTKATAHPKGGDDGKGSALAGSNDLGGGQQVKPSSSHVGLLTQPHDPEETRTGPSLHSAAGVDGGGGALIAQDSETIEQSPDLSRTIADLLGCP